MKARCTRTIKQGEELFVHYRMTDLMTLKEMSGKGGLFEFNGEPVDKWISVLHQSVKERHLREAWYAAMQLFLPAIVHGYVSFLMRSVGEGEVIRYVEDHVKDRCKKDISDVYDSMQWILALISYLCSRKRESNDPVDTIKEHMKKINKTLVTEFIKNR